GWAGGEPARRPAPVPGRSAPAGWRPSRRRGTVVCAWVPPSSPAASLATPGQRQPAAVVVALTRCGRRLAAFRARYVHAPPSRAAPLDDRDRPRPPAGVAALGRGALARTGPAGLRGRLGPAWAGRGGHRPGRGAVAGPGRRRDLRPGAGAAGN